MKVTNVPTTDFSSSAKTFFADAVTTVTKIKDSAGQFYLLDLVNSAAATTYVQIFFKPAAQVVLGTTAADLTFKLASTATNGFARTLDFPVPVGGIGLAGAGTGLSLACTTTATGSTTAAVGVTALYL